MEYVWSDNEDNWYESLEDLIDMMDLQEGDFVYKGGENNSILQGIYQY